MFSETYHELHGSDLSVRPHSGHLKARVDESAVSKKPVTTNFWFTFYSMIVPFHVITRSECKVWSIKPQLHSHRQNWIYLYFKFNLTIFQGAEFRLMKIDFFSSSSHCVKSCLVNFLRLDWITFLIHIFFHQNESALTAEIFRPWRGVPRNFESESDPSVDYRRK